MSPAIEVFGLRKRYGRSLALGGLTVSVESGAAVALLGPNGAGKTTFLRLCATLLRPTAGKLQLFGLDAANHGPAVRRRLGVLGHESLLYPDLTPTENLLFYARLFRVVGGAARVGELIERMELHGWAHRPVRTLSRGLVQRCALARVLLHRPELLLLDEPLTGLDFDARATLAEVLREEHRRGTTLVMSTHELAAGLDLCTSALVLTRGRLAWQGAIAPEERESFERVYPDLVRGALGDPQALSA
jgi:heme exporter protein A